MLIRYFKGTGFNVIFLVILVLAVLWLGAFLNHNGGFEIVDEDQVMPLYDLLRSVSGNDSILSVSLSLSIVAVITILIVNFNTTNFFINKRTYIPALLYISFSGLFPEYQRLNPCLPASLFLMIALIRIMKGYRKQGTAFNFFDATILISTGSLFYFNLIWFGLLVIIGIVLLRNVNLKEIFISVLGLLTPYILTFGLYYVIGKEPGTLLEVVRHNIQADSPVIHFSRLTILVIVYTSVVLSISIVHLLMVMKTKKIRSRKIFSLLIWIFLISSAIYFLISPVSVEIFWLLIIPSCYFLAHYYVSSRGKVFHDILLSVFLVFVLLLQILSFT